MREQTSTTLRFIGDWPWWLGLGAAVGLGALSWILYRRDVGQMASWIRWGLPALRASAVAMIVVMLSGPVLHHRQVVGELSRLLLFVDGSRSMDLSDPSMEPGRKVRILQQLGLLSGSTMRMEFPKAADALAEVQSLMERAKVSQELDTSEWNRILTDIAGKANEAREALSQSGSIDPECLTAFGREVSEPVREIAGREMRQIDDRQRAVRDLIGLNDVVERWKAEIGELFQNSLTAGGADGNAVKVAMEKFDALPRWQRLQTMLLEGAESSMLNNLARAHDVQLLVLEGGSASKVWQSNIDNSNNSTNFPELPKPSAEITDLATGVKTFFGSGSVQEQKGAVVVFSDGQHNEGESPIEVARVLGGRQMPVFTIGFGSQNRPRDLALIKVEAPESAFFEDRVRGQVVIKDDMPAGQSFTVAIKDGQTAVWEQPFVTEGKGVRRVSFEFPLADLAKARLGRQRDGVQISGVPVELAVKISQVAGEREVTNNDSVLRVRAVTQRRKILLVEGRPRWETRYLRNLFDRDEQWDVNAVIVGMTAGEAGLKRGDGPDQFPTSATALAAYDLIIFGEVPRSALKENEMEWIRDFVSQRGGAVIFIDGPRGSLKEYGNTPLGPLFPVEWRESPSRSQVSRLMLTERSQDLAAFALAPERAQNLELWQGLQTPRWFSGATPLPGAEVLIEAEVPGTVTGRLAAAVARPFGAGRVLYHGFEDSWRWRYEVADKNHVKYWNQMANWIAELPFAIRDKFVSLDAGAITYRPGESADVRVRLRDGEGKPVTDAVVDAVLYREGQRVASMRLTPDDNAGGLFRGRTAALQPGNYEVGIESPAIPERDTRARTEFKVERLETAELAQLNANEDLLRQVADASGGQYLREEQLPKLLELLAPLSQGRVIESDTVLWQSYWWFIPLIGLLTIEWILRKRVGLL
jgi:hypothetical protein